jgi:hypothetical protein
MFATTFFFVIESMWSTNQRVSVALKIGFIILSYDKPDQLRRLVLTLSRMYGDPPIVCNHDWNQCPISSSGFPKNVRFIRPHVPMKWGHVSCIDAELQALEVIYQTHDPDWFVLLSGSDYPVQSAATVQPFLAGCSFDALIQTFPITYPPHNAETKRFFNRYVAAKFTLPLPACVGGERSWTCGFAAYPRWSAFYKMTCFGGEHWFIGNRRSAAVLLSSLAQEVRSHYVKRPIPEESFYHTVLGNHDGLRLSPATKRFSLWVPGGKSPSVLSLRDLPAIRRSGAFFARKFDMAIDPQVFDAIDLMTKC